MYKLDEVDQFVINSCIKGLSFEEIARAMKYDERKMKSRIESLKERGINVYPGMKGITLKEIDLKVHELFNQGLNQTQIAAKLNRSKQAISTRISRMKSIGIQFSTDNNEKEIQRENVCKLVKKGLSRDKIAEKLNMEEKDVENCIMYLRKYGLISEVTRRKKKKNSKEFFLDEMDHEILKLKSDKLYLKEIGDILGKNKMTIFKRIKRMKENGIEVPNTPIKLHSSLRERNLEIAEKYQNGMSAKKIAEEYRISETRVYGIVGNLGVMKVKQNRIKDRNLRSKRDMEVVDLFQKGESVGDIAIKYDIAETTVRHILGNHGLTPMKINDSVKKEVLKLKDEGLSLSKISKQVGISTSSAYRIINSAKESSFKKAIDGASKEELITAIRNLIDSKNATEEQLKKIAELCNIDEKDVLNIGKYIDER